MPLSPELMQALAARGLVPPPDGAVAPQPVPPPVPTFAPDLSAPPPAPRLPPPIPAEYRQPAAPPPGGAQLPPVLAAQLRAQNAAGMPDRAPPQAPASTNPSDYAPPPAPPQAQQPQVAPMRVLPAHEVRAVSPGTERMYDAASREERSAADAGTSAAIGQNEASAQGLDNMARTLAEQRGPAQRAEAQRQRETAEQQADYDRLRAEAAQGKVERPDIGIMGHIAGFFGALGAGLTGGPNYALQNINRRIDDNIAIQRDAIEGKRKDASAAGTSLDKMTERFGDQRRAEMGERALQLEQAKASVDAMTAHAGSPVLAAKGEALKAQIDMEQAKLHQQMFPWLQAQAVGGAMQKPLDNVFMGTDGQRYQARDPESRKVLTKSAAAVQDVTSGAKDYAAALSQVSATDRAAAKIGYTTTAMARAQAAYNGVMTAVRQAHDDGVWKKGETEMLAQTLVPPEHFTGDAQAQLGMITKQARDIYAHQMTTEDALPVQQGFAQTPTGALAPRNAYTGGTVAPQAPGASSVGRPVQ